MVRCSGGTALETVEQIVPDVQVRKQAVLLEDHGNAPLFGRQIDLFCAAEEALAIQDYLAAVRHKKPRQHAHQGRFAAA